MRIARPLTFAPPTLPSALSLNLPQSPPNLPQHSTSLLPSTLNENVQKEKNRKEEKENEAKEVKEEISSSGISSSGVSTTLLFEQPPQVRPLQKTLTCTPGSYQV